MSWWAGVRIDTGADLIEVDDRNITYNVSRLFRLVLSHPEGLRGFHKAPASEAGGVFARAADELEALPQEIVRPLEPANGWGSRDSAVKDLRWLAETCARAPKGEVYVH